MEKKIEVSDQIANTETKLAQDLAAATDMLSDALGAFKNHLGSLLSIPGGTQQTAPVAPRRSPRGTEMPVMRKRTLGEVLAEGPVPEVALVEMTGGEREKLQAELRALRKGRRVANFGDDSAPLWVRRIGQDASIGELSEVIRKMLTLKQNSERPSLTLRELCDATGGREGRVSAALVHLKKHGVPIVNIGRPRKAEWSLGQK